MTTAIHRAKGVTQGEDALEVWRASYGELEQKHTDLERDYWQLQGQYSEFQNQHRQILRLIQS